MQFYPHNIPVSSIASAVSASRTVTGSLIANFSAIAVNTVNTASVALNITGSRGTDGTNVAVIGPTGATGPRGETGYRGKSIFLLSGSWNTGTCGGGFVSECTGSYTLYNIGPGFGECNYSQGSSTYWTNYTSSESPPLPEFMSITDTSADGYILYNNSVCSSPAINVSVHNGSRIFYTDGAGVISSTGCSS